MKKRKENPSFFSTYKLINAELGQVFTDKLQICVVDLTQIDKASEDDISSGLARWARLFKAKSWEELKAIGEEDTEMEDTVRQTYDFINMDKFEKAMQDIAESDRIHRENIRKKQAAEIENQKAEIDSQKAEIEQHKTEIEHLADENARLKALLSSYGITEQN